VLLIEKAIIDCNAAGLMVPSLSKSDFNLPLDIPYSEMKRWKSQTKQRPFWIQIQLKPAWISHNSEITYLEIQLDSKEMDKLERVLRDKEIVCWFDIANYGPEVFCRDNVY
jgi:hypothetical protein